MVECKLRQNSQKLEKKLFFWGAFWHAFFRNHILKLRSAQIIVSARFLHGFGGELALARLRHSIFGGGHMSESIVPVILRMSAEDRATALADSRVADIEEAYEIHEELGVGSSGAAVFLAALRSTDELVAIKVLDISALEEDELHALVANEAGLLRRVSHPRVVRLRRTMRDEQSFWFEFDALRGGELLGLLQRDGALTEAHARDCFAQVAAAVGFLHESGITHRDIKAENLVFESADAAKLVLVDFGTAAPATEGLEDMVCTPQYAAAEVVRAWGNEGGSRAAYTSACDMWSLGVLLHVMLSASLPFRAKESPQLLRQVAEGKLDMTGARWQGVSAHAKDVVRRLVVVRPCERLTMPQLSEHKWCREAFAAAQAALASERSAPRAPPSPPRGAGDAYMASNTGAVEAALSAAVGAVLRSRSARRVIA